MTGNHDRGGHHGARRPHPPSRRGDAGDPRPGLLGDDGGRHLPGGAAHQRRLLPSLREQGGPRRGGGRALLADGGDAPRRRRRPRHRGREGALRARRALVRREPRAPHASRAAGRLRPRESEARPRGRPRVRVASPALYRVPVPSARRQEGVTTRAIPRGRFIWYDLMTTDPKSAAAFYADVIGWSTQDHPMAGGGTYTIFSK